MAEIGRNDPCPCGSGKKYKKCCLNSGDNKVSTDFLWHNIRTTRESVYKKLQGHSAKIYDKEDISEAWNTWCMEYPEPFMDQEDETLLFVSWLLFNWMNPKKEPPEMPVCLLYSKSSGSNLSGTEYDYINAVISEPFSFYEVVKTRPGHGFLLRCAFTGREVYVTEHSASLNVYSGDIFFARLANIGEITIFDAVSGLLFPPESKSIIIEVRKEIRRVSKVRKNQELKKEHLYITEQLIIDVYRGMRNEASNPRHKDIRNTDGDPLSFNKVIFDVDDPDAVFEALYPLCIMETRESILETAEKDTSNRIIKVQFDWCKEGNEQHKSWNNTILGNIIIEKGRMTIEVNSVKRAEAIKGIISTRCSGYVRYKTTLIESYEAKIAEYSSRPASALMSSEETKAQQELMEHPEVKAKLREIMQTEMESWIYKKVPALGNITPVQAVKTTDGREMVEALLNQFERRSDVLGGEQDFHNQLIRGIRKKLGLRE